MRSLSAEQSFDSDVRLAGYRFFIDRCRAPTAAELARTHSSAPSRVWTALRRLERRHALVLQEGAAEILRAAPFWAVPTLFPVTIGKKSWWASCIGDALGIPAMLGRDALINTSCGCCGGRMQLKVKRGAIDSADGVVHFAVPARRWYENIVFT